MARRARPDAETETMVLHSIETTARIIESQQRQLRRAVREAVRGGIPVPEIAAAAGGLSRQTIYTWADAPDEE